MSSVNLWALSKSDKLYFLQQIDNVTATINKETTDIQFNDLIAYFKSNNIQLEVNEVSRNNQKEITGLSLSLEKENQQTSYNMHSNTPISDLELGYKDGNVFIGNIADTNAFAGTNSLNHLFNSLNQNGATLDSLLSENQFSFSFGSDDIRKLLNESSFDFDQMQEDFFNQFFNSQNNSASKKENTPPSASSNFNTLPKYNFINKKNIKKLIIIDGKESNFKTLDALAKADQLKDVDNLKISTAISLYGNKAKDGAIIATTK